MLQIFYSNHAIDDDDDDNSHSYTKQSIMSCLYLLQSCYGRGHSRSLCLELDHNIQDHFLDEILSL